MISAVIVGLAVGIAFIFVLNLAVEQVPSEKVITGEVVCLPPNPGLDVVRAICANGFYDTGSGKYYALVLDGEHRWLYTANNSDELFIVTATVTQPTESNSNRFDVSGTIENVTSVSTVDGSTSIYEVKYRHSSQLLAILQEIKAATGGGWSMGIVECDDGEPCIRITLDKDIHELTDKIPRELEGYKVDVQVMNN